MSDEPSPPPPGDARDGQSPGVQDGDEDTPVAIGYPLEVQEAEAKKEAEALAAKDAAITPAKSLERAFDVRYDGPETAMRTRSDGFDLRRFRKLVLGFIILAILVLIPGPRDLSQEAQRVIALFIFIVYLWISEALPLPVTALLAGVGIVLLGIKTDPNDAFEPYAQDTFFFILGSLILADGIAKSGADEVIAARVLKIFGRNTHTLIFGIVASTALLSAFASAHAVAAIMLPIVLGLLRHTGLRKEPNIAAAMLIGIALGANVAGLATPSAGSRNAIIIGYLSDLYDTRIGYLQWMEYAFPITLVLIPVSYVVLALVFRVPVRRISFDPSKLAARAVLSNRQRLAFGILAITVALWISVGHIGLGTIAIIGAALMFTAGILDWEDTRSTIPWGVAFVYGAALAMGRQLKDTGGADWLAEHAFLYLPHDPVILVSAVVGVGVLMTNFMSDGATAAALGPVALSFARIANFPLVTMGLLVAMSSAFSYLFVIGTPSNLIVYASGLVRAKDFLRTGIPMLIISVILLLTAVFWYWPMLA